MRNYLPLLLVLSLSLAGCPDDTEPSDTGADTPALDAPVAMDVPSAIDAPVATDDTPAAQDAPVAEDAPVADDAPPLADTRVIPAGECADSDPCPSTCLIATICVTECGGPETNYGCCPCAEGSMSALSCPSED